MNIQVSDPLQLLPYQSGAVTSPGQESAADASSDLTGPQQIAKIGDPVPIVFCRRRNNNGGVFVSPKATEARYENNVTIATVSETFANGVVVSQTVRAQEFIDISLCLVISEGNMNQLKLSDMFLGECKKGTYAQTYDRRAGTWIPGNFTDTYLTQTVSGNSLPASAVAGESYLLKDLGKVYHYFTSSVQGFPGFVTTDHVKHDFPQYCGTSGSYDDMTVVSFEHRLFNLDNWNLQVHAFVREGMNVTRLIDSTSGPSDNFVDLAKYLIDKSAAVPSELINLSLMVRAANFCETNGFFYNGKIENSQNLSDWMQSHAHFFLLRLAKVDGAFGFRPTLPVVQMGVNYNIKTTAISALYVFTEEELLPDGFEIEYIPLSERNEVVMQMMWREQPDADVGIARTLNVKFTGASSDGPFEQHDLSNFCTNENHAAKVGAYMLSRRRNITHNLRIKVRPGSHSTDLSVGDIARVRLRRETSVDVVEHHDFLYEIDRIEKTSTGPVIYDLTHFPIDSQGRSVVALDVSSATGTGISLDTGRQNTNCNDNTASTDLPDVGRGPFDGSGSTPTTPSESDVVKTLTPAGDANFDVGGSSPIGQTTNPDDPFDGPPAPFVTGFSGTPTIGDTLTLQPGCAGAFIKWYKININTNAVTLIGSGVGATLAVTEALVEEGVRVYGEGCCPDDLSPSGFGPCLESAPVDLFDEIVDCPGGGDSGNQGTFTKVINVGSAFPASFNFRYSAFTIQDRFVISGAATLDTGFVSGTNVNVSVSKTSADKFITVTVFAPQSGTAWNYDVGCAS
jgi:hypothetical protein|tara:strand:- start:1783 stop:4164 length:2382 start_codon:yes stop_codon:yes gene_type:complete